MSDTKKPDGPRPAGPPAADGASRMLADEEALVAEMARSATSRREFLQLMSAAGLGNRPQAPMRSSRGMHRRRIHSRTAGWTA